MVEILWLSGMLFASVWAGGGCQTAEGNFSRTPILPPIQQGEVPACAEPERADILRALPTLPLGIPYVYEHNREDVEIVLEKLVDRVDPPRVYPLLGPAQLHHCHWKCTVSFTDTTEVTYPFAINVKQRHTEVVYIDNDRLHLYEPREEKDPPAVKSVNEEDLPEPDNSSMSMEDVVKMWRNGVSRKIILKQMEVTDAVFDLDADDIIYLHQQGVGNRIIGAMQERHRNLANTVIGPTTGTIISNGKRNPACGAP